MKKLFEIYKETMLSPKEVLDKAIASVVSVKNSSAKTKTHFSEIIDETGRKAYDVFLIEQEKAGRRAIECYFSGLVSQKDSSGEAIKKVAGQFKAFDRFFLSLAQSRKPRAGSTFEWMIKELFKKLNYPFAEQQVINGKPDFLMPSREHYDKNPMDCIIFTVKTTLRERWRQIVTEGTRGLGFFLATADEKVSENQLGEMLRNRIYLVVSKSLKRKISHYSCVPNVLSYEQFFRDYVEPSVRRWKKSKAI